MWGNANPCWRDARERYVVGCRTDPYSRAPRARRRDCQGILRDAALRSEICSRSRGAIAEIKRGADVAIVTEEATRSRRSAGSRRLVGSQPPWSDFPFILADRAWRGLERNPAAARLMELLAASHSSSASHTLISMVQTGLRARAVQYECRHPTRIWSRGVDERTAELAAAIASCSQIRNGARRIDPAADAAAGGPSAS